MEKKESANWPKTTGYAITINRLLRKRAELFTEAIGYRKRLHEISKDVEAIDRTLKLFDHEGDLDVLMPRRVQDVIFKRGELAELVFTRLRYAGRPLGTREIACLIILERGENVKDKKYVTKVTVRVYKKLMRLKKEGEVRLAPGNKGKQRWELALF